MDKEINFILETEHFKGRLLHDDVTIFDELYGHSFTLTYKCLFSQF